jgi:3-octaprenyl-4-hydroxybenzoate carboxy-lyase Rift-related domain/3-octaprenyl-4-hydroxybenzoate carboxy-lyase N-terminal domain
MENMAYPGLRDWIAKIDAVGELKQITAEVDWNLELGAIARRVVTQQGPALLFENIKDYRHSPCRRVFANGLGTRERTAMALGLPRETDYRGIVHFFKENFSRRLEPILVSGGPVKKNVIRGKDINLYEFPVPKYNPLDGGRYINTHACVVTMDPDTKLMNIGVYRGMIGQDEKSIAVLLVRSQHWGAHFSKYEQRREEMPVAVFYGCDPLLLMWQEDGGKSQWNWSSVKPLTCTFLPRLRSLLKVGFLRTQGPIRWKALSGSIRGFMEDIENLGPSFVWNASLSGTIPSFLLTWLAIALAVWVKMPTGRQRAIRRGFGGIWKTSVFRGSPVFGDLR